jgi:hypothetical protein
MKKLLILCLTVSLLGSISTANALSVGAIKRLPANITKVVNSGKRLKTSLIKHRGSITIQYQKAKQDVIGGVKNIVKTNTSVGSSKAAINSAILKNTYNKR